MMEWPWQYSFPPFFTLQPHAPTREKQLEEWKHLVLSYCQASFLEILIGSVVEPPGARVFGRSRTNIFPPDKPPASTCYSSFINLKHFILNFPEPKIILVSCILIFMDF